MAPQTHTPKPREVHSPFWTPLIGLGLRALLFRRVRALSDTNRWANHAEHIQRLQLRNLLRQAAGTEIGRKHRFAELAERPDHELVTAYRDTLPTGDYEAFRKTFARMREDAEPDVTWPGTVMDWAQTSGTTGGEKYIPVSKHMMRSNYRAALDIFAHATRFGVSLPHLFAGKLFFLGGSTATETNQHGIRTGDLSGLVTPLIRWPLSRVYSPGPDVALMDHWPSKIEAMAQLALRQDVRMVSGMASWSLVLFKRVLELARESSRASTLKELWPHFTLFVHGGVRYAPFDPGVREAFSGSDDTDNHHNDIPYRLEVYPASEGFIAMQDTHRDPGLRLLIDNDIFFEFIPVEEIDNDQPSSFTCTQVDKGQRYVVVLTTCAGLWRYVIGDVVQFETIPPDGPPRLRIVGRHRHFINAFGENLIVEHIENAVVHARQQTHAEVGEFTAAPVYPEQAGRAATELAIEWQGQPDDNTLQRFRDAFDQSLRNQNVDYDTKRRDDFAMGPPVVTPVPPGTFHRWMQQQGKLGGQHKAPRCANDRDTLEQIIQTARNNP